MGIFIITSATLRPREIASQMRFLSRRRTGPSISMKAPPATSQNWYFVNVAIFTLCIRLTIERAFDIRLLIGLIKPGRSRICRRWWRALRQPIKNSWAPVIYFLHREAGSWSSTLTFSTEKALSLSAGSRFTLVGRDLALRYDAFRGQLKESAMAGTGYTDETSSDTETIRHGNDNEDYFPPSITEIA